MDEAGAYLRRLQRNIDHLQTCLPREIFVGLLLIRAVSLPWFPRGRSTPKAAACPERPATDLWELLVNTRTTQLPDTAINILASLRGDFPCVQSLLDQERFIRTDVFVLRELVNLFSSFPVDPLLSRQALDQTVKRAMAKYVGKGAAYSAPAALIRSLGTVLNPEAGKVRELRHELGQSGAETGGWGGPTGDGAFDVLCRMESLLRRPDPVTEPPSDSPTGGKWPEWGNWDGVVANPPFNVSHWHDDRVGKMDKRWSYGEPPRSNANFAWLQHCLAGLQPKGRAAVLLPTSSLISTNRREQNIRKNMVESGVVEAIVTFPPGLFPTTKVPFCLWLLDKAGQQAPDAPVLFVDAEQMEPKLCQSASEEVYNHIIQMVKDFRNGTSPKSDWAVSATLREIAAQEYRLSPNLYRRHRRARAFSEEAHESSWGDCLEKLQQGRGHEALLAKLTAWTWKRPCAWQKASLTTLYTIFGGVAVSKDAFGDGVPFLDVKTIVRYPFLPRSLSRRVRLPADKGAIYRIRRGDVIINRTSETLKELGLGCVALQDSEAIYTGFAKRLRPIRPGEIEPTYAAAYFRSGLYLSQVRENVPFIPVSRASLNNQHLARMEMYYPPLERQQEIGEVFYGLTVWKNVSNREEQKLLTQVQSLFLERAIFKAALGDEGFSQVREAE